MVYERGRLVPAAESERLRKQEETKHLFQGIVIGFVCGGGAVALAFTVGVWWGVIVIIGLLVAIALEGGGGGPTSGEAGNSVPGMGPGG